MVVDLQRLFFAPLHGLFIPYIIGQFAPRVFAALMYPQLTASHQHGNDADTVVDVVVGILYPVASPPQHDLKACRRRVNNHHIRIFTVDEALEIIGILFVRFLPHLLAAVV